MLFSDFKTFSVFLIDKVVVQEVLGECLEIEWFHTQAATELPKG